MKSPRAARVLGLLPVAIVCLVAARNAGGQRTGTKFTIDPKASLAWWQINPHRNSLWATTCPEEPSWLPGQGRSSGGADGTDIARASQSGSDTSQIPLFPRYHVRAVCTEAVHGELVAPDTVTWKGAHGKVAVDAAALTTGNNWRDTFSRTVVLQANTHSQIVLTIDSVVNVTRSGGDTVHALAVGTLFLRGVNSPLSVPVLAWHDAGGMRVKGRWYITDIDLLTKYQVSDPALGAGRHVWTELWVGVDVVMRPEPVTAP